MRGVIEKAQENRSDKKIATFRLMQQQDYSFKCKEKTRKRDKLLFQKYRQVIKWGCIVAGTAILYRWGVAWALAERGYRACGGELLLLLIPFLYYIAERIAMDFAADIREFWADCQEEEE